MAATLTSAGELTFMSFPITKFETTEDGDLYVYGKATDGSVDSDEQIVDTDFSSKAIANWLATGANVRVQHNASRDPAGVGVEVNTDSDGTTWVKSLVVEPVAKTLVEKKALRAYSVGIARPKIVRDAVARGGRIVDGEIVEISLVDRPANKNCGIELVKADKDGNAEFTGKIFGDGDVLTKSAAVETEPNITLEITGNATFSPADLAKLLAHRATAEKRQMDPNVGGGTDRDKIPAADFAGRDRSFPIVTPGDVSDAASSIGRAGTDNYSSDELRSRITSIAHRKGPQFVAQLPDSWTKGDGVTDVEKSLIVEGEEPTNVVTGDDKKGDAEAKPDATKADAKGGKTCGNCGKGHDADSKLRSCSGCGHDLPHAGAPSSEKSEGDEKVESPVKKSKVSCPKCAAKCGMKSAFCKKCGAAMKGEGMKPEDESVEKGKPTPGEGVVGVGASAVEPVPAHREPDGAAIEALESDAGLPTTADASVKAAQRVKAVGAPADLGALHDLTCPAFDPAVVKNAYPSDTFAGLDDMAWQQKALDAAANAPLEEAGKMTQLWQHVSTLKAADATMLDEVRADVYKSFQDANPGPGSFPTPMELSPVRFRRPLITAGHADEGTGHDGPNTAKVPTNHIDASDFTRGPLTGDHAAQSPSNKGRTFYRNVQRDAALHAMAALHDHIAQTFPDLCTVHENTGGAGTDPNPLPTSVGKADETPVETKVEATPEVKPETINDTVVKAAGGVGADLIKSAVTEALTPLAEQVEILAKALVAEQAKNAKLAETVEELSNLADPTVTAFKGVAAPDALKSSTPVASTVASAAERTQVALTALLQEQTRSSDPSEREAAWSKLYQMNGIQ